MIEKLLLGLGLVLFVIVIGPIAVIWSLNTLFPVLNIPLNFDTWCAAVVLAGVFKSSYTYKK
jgi:hypothetical protein